MYRVQARNQAPVMSHMSIPPALLLDGARPPTMIRQLRPVENIFVPRVAGGISTNSVDARENCTLEKFGSILRETSSNGDGNNCWFKMIMKPPKYCFTYGYHRWHNKGSKTQDGWTRTKYILSHGTEPCAKYKYGFDLFEYKYANAPTTFYMMKRVRNNSGTLTEAGFGSQSTMHPENQWPDLPNRDYATHHDINIGDSDGFYWPGLLSDTMQKTGAIAIGNYDAFNNGAASTGFSSNGNHYFASYGPLGELLPPSVLEANNNKSEIAHRNSTYLQAGLSAVQGNQRADPSGTAGFISLPMSNSLHVESRSAFPNIDYHAGPSGTVGDSIEASYADINYDNKWYEEYYRK